MRPDADVEVTEVGSYHDLLQHIEVHRYYLGIEQQREIPWQEAVASWYDNVYLPVAAAIWASDYSGSIPRPHGCRPVSVGLPASRGSAA